MSSGTSIWRRVARPLEGVRSFVFLLVCMVPVLVMGQGSDAQVKAKADALFIEGRYFEALPLYSQLVSLEPSDRTLNYRFGACLLFGGEDKEKAIGHLKYATEDPSSPADAWYWLGRAYHLSYRFKEAQVVYQHYKGIADKKILAERPVDAFEVQCRNGQKLLANLKEITVRSKVEVEDREFFRYYDLSDIGGRIVVTPEELKSSLDKKNKLRSLVYLPGKGGRFYFSSYGKDGKTGLDIYSSELLPDGRFATPEKLAGFINTDLDDDYPFMHPDGKTFYFSSKGHNSMGGYDVFKAVFDRGLYTFGRPENLDFAVNTPDDDIYYMVDAEHKEACFASARSSRQGKVHVYRVSTERMPLVITVLKGTYSSEFDANDRRAHIIVEDATTREQVADVRTDMNGTYVLALPRTGRFRFLVECGPSGKTHVGMVDVPRSDQPRAYRQELSLVRNGDLEKLMIRNYFDNPLDDDLIALAMEEIRRRARLDVNADRVVAQTTQEPLAPAGDIMTRAGFTGDISKEDALRLAQDDAKELAQKVSSLGAQRSEAYAMAVDAITESERTAREAQQIIDEASATTDESLRNKRMLEAATLRQRSREASMRARAAQLSAQELEEEELYVRQRSMEATKLATDLSGSLNNGRDQDALKHLVSLRERLDSKSGPSARPDIAEAARRAVSEQEREAAKALDRAHAKRTEESELTDRINRLERERDGTGNKGRKEDLDREISGYKEQLGFLREETATALARANTLERGTAVMRGKASLIRYLTSSEPTSGGMAPTSDEVAALARRITSNDTRIAALPIDERYDALIVTTDAEVEARSFDWELAAASAAGGAPITTTRTMDRDQGGDAQRNSTRSTDVQRSDVVGEQPQGRTVTQVPVSNDGGTVGTTERTVSDDIAGPGERNSSTTGGDALATRSSDAAQGGTDADVSAQQGSGKGKDGAVPTGTGTEEGGRSSEDGLQSTLERDLAAGAVAVEPMLTPEEVRNTTITTPQDQDQEAANDAALLEDSFLLENELSETRQLAAAERSRNRRDSLETRISELERKLEVAQARERNVEPVAADPTEQLRREVGISGSEIPDNSRVPLVFAKNVEDSVLQQQLYSDYKADRQRLLSMPDRDHQAAGLHGLELMMADSIRGEMSRQVAVLELDPQQAEVVLPRLDRLRKLRDTHLKNADQVLEDRRLEVAALAATSPVENTDGPSTPVSVPRDGWIPGTPTDEIDDHYVAFAPLREEVYESDLKHRSSKVDDALALKNADLIRIDSLSNRIDSMSSILTQMPPGRDREKLQRETDRLRDDRLIVRTDLGQRTAFLTKEELAVANDSLKQLERIVTRQGRSPGEPIMLMAKEIKEESQRRALQASENRRKADRSDNIVERDSLYRSAYALELVALRDLDRSITVNNYLVGGQYTPGEVLTYKEIAAKVLGKGTTTTAGVLAQRDEPRDVAEPPSVVSPTEKEGSGGEVISEGTAAREVEPTIPKESVNGSSGEPEERAEAPTEVSPATGTNEPGVPTVIPTTSAAGVASARSAAQKAAQEEAAQADSRLDPKAAAPAKRFDHYLANEPAILPVNGDPSTDDPQLLGEVALRAAQDAERLEQEAWDLSAQAAEQEKQATSAKRKERIELEKLAVRNRQLADSVSKAAVLKTEESMAATDRQQAAEQVQVLRERLIKYYYLTNEEEALVINNPDESRYFQARSRALEQYDAADEATSAAVANRALGEALRKEAENAAIDPQYRTREERQERARVFLERSDRLLIKADSLDNVSARLRGAAALNESQASVMLQGLSQDDASRLMALEMGARRAEILLAETRGQAGDQRPATRVAAATGDVARIDPAGSRAANNTTSNATDSAPPASTEGANTTARTSGNASALPEVLTGNIFQLRPDGTRNAAPIPIDSDKPGGVVFAVQIGAFRNAIPESTFSDMTPVLGERLDNGLTRYTAGLFTDLRSASGAKDQVRGRGYRDAFVVAYKDGVRISLADAQRALASSDAVAQAGTTERTDQASTPTQQPVQRTTEVPVRAQPPTPQPATSQTPTSTQPPTTIQPPTATQPPSQQQETETVLASYPKSAQEIVSSYTPAVEAASYYNEPGAAPARQVETVKGLFFTVQVGVYSKPVALDKLFNISPLNSELTETRKIRYTTGIYLSEERARTQRDEAVTLGVKDAFITAYLNGKRIPMRDARVLLERYGPEVLAKP